MRPANPNWKQQRYKLLEEKDELEEEIEFDDYEYDPRDFRLDEAPARGKAEEQSRPKEVDDFKEKFLIRQLNLVGVQPKDSNRSSRKGSQVHAPAVVGALGREREYIVNVLQKYKKVNHDDDFDQGQKDSASRAAAEKALNNRSTLIRSQGKTKLHWDLIIIVLSVYQAF